MIRMRHQATLILGYATKVNVLRDIGKVLEKGWLELALGLVSKFLGKALLYVLMAYLVLRRVL